MKIKINKTTFITLLIVLLVTTNVAALNISNTNTNEIENNTDSNNIKSFFTNYKEDLDPLIDLKITVTIKEIRAFDPIDLFTDPDFYVKVFVNDQEFTSEVSPNKKYVTDDWSITTDVPDDEEFVNITIQLWDKNYVFDRMCDIEKNDNQNTNRKDITVYYSLKTGHWYGDDSMALPSDWYPDYSGYGRGNGCDDNTIYKKDRDCELTFDITQNDYDNDTIPYWTEMNIYNKTGQCNPLIDDRGRDDDNDGIPIEWEHKWGHYFDWEYNHTTDEYIIIHKWKYHPFEYNDHKNLDPDLDSINNYEEYLTSQWGSDPFRRDLFVELDQMNGTVDIQDSLLPEGSKDLIKDAFNRQNIVFHLDDGSWGNNSESDMIPFDHEGDNTTHEELREIYKNYFLDGDENNWRKGVFHYGLVVYNATFPGFAFSNSAYQISRKGMEAKTENPFVGSREVVYACAYMHELGHTLGLTWLLGHDTEGYGPFQLLWWQARPYKSIMNYGYMYGFLWNNFVDFSDGSRGKNDFDDWGNIDLAYFES